MRGRALLLAAPLAASCLAASASPDTRPTPRPTAIPTPGVRWADDGADLHATPTPTSVVSRRLVAALDVQQGEGGERTALFEDGTLVHVVRLRGRSTTSRRGVSREELALLSHVVAEVLTLHGEEEKKSPLLLDATRRRMRLEVGDGEQIHEFVFDEVSALPLQIGRAKTALEDLRERFIARPVEKRDLWDASGVKEGDLLKRRGNGRWFRVIRDDNFGKNFEVREVGPSGIGQFLKRDDLPKLFEDPDTVDPAELPR
jgi:hypothetical protein